jgi:hypothetical protein
MLTQNPKLEEASRLLGEIQEKKYRLLKLLRELNCESYNTPDLVLQLELNKILQQLVGM